MSVLDIEAIDGVAINKDGNELRMLISDHLEWENEYEHLFKLQNKINSYLCFIDSRQYIEIYPKYNFSMFCIEIHFKHEITKNCSKFLKVINKQLLASNITVEYFIK